MDTGGAEGCGGTGAGDPDGAGCPAPGSCASSGAGGSFGATQVVPVAWARSCCPPLSRQPASKKKVKPKAARTERGEVELIIDLPSRRAGPIGHAEA